MGVPHRISTLLLGSVLALSATRSLRAEATPSPAEKKMIQAIEAQNNGWYTTAKGMLDEAEALDPNVKGLTHHRAVQALGEGKLEEAKALARKCLADGQGLADAHNLLGVIAAKSGDNAEADKEFRAAIKVDPGNARGYYNYSEYLRQTGRSREALTQIDLALEKAPNETIFILKKRLARLESGDGDALAQETAAALKDRPQASWLLAGAAIALQRDKKEEAIILLRNARTGMPPDLFLALMVNDPFFQKYAKESALAEFYAPVENDAPPENSLLN